jgi:hypothetical protein
MAITSIDMIGVIISTDRAAAQCCDLLQTLRGHPPNDSITLPRRLYPLPVPRIESEAGYGQRFAYGFFQR